VTRRLAAAPSSGPAWEPFLMWRILTASLGAGGVSGHRMIRVILAVLSARASRR